MAVALHHTVREFMSDSVDTISPQGTLGRAAEIMNIESIGCLPVTEHGHLAGIITDRDIVVRGLIDGAHGAFLADTPVHKIMTTRTLVTVKPNDDIGTAIALMTEHRVRRLPVIDDAGNVVGLLSLGDVVQGTGCSDAVKEAVIAVTTQGV